jgi:hypothetical protein
MAKVLTSWKEIAQYFGKGVRTVQRWEAAFGLPIRRPQSENHSAIIAIPEELDAWVMNHTRLSGSRLEALQAENAKFREENAMLRQRLAEALKTDLRKTSQTGQPTDVLRLLA